MGKFFILQKYICVNTYRREAAQSYICIPADIYASVCKYLCR